MSGFPELRGYSHYYDFMPLSSAGIAIELVTYEYYTIDKRS